MNKTISYLPVSSGRTRKFGSISLIVLKRKFISKCFIFGICIAPADIIVKLLSLRSMLSRLVRVSPKVLL